MQIVSLFGSSKLVQKFFRRRYQAVTQKRFRKTIHCEFCCPTQSCRKLSIKQHSEIIRTIRTFKIYHMPAFAWKGSPTMPRITSWKQKSTIFSSVKILICIKMVLPSCKTIGTKWCNVIDFISIIKYSSNLKLFNFCFFYQKNLFGHNWLKELYFWYNIFAHYNVRHNSQIILPLVTQHHKCLTLKNNANCVNLSLNAWF